MKWNDWITLVSIVQSYFLEKIARPRFRDEMVKYVGQPYNLMHSYEQRVQYRSAHPSV